MVKLTPEERMVYDEMVTERKDAHGEELKTVMKGNAHSTGTKFDSSDKVIGSTGRVPAFGDSQKRRRALRTELARHLEVAADPDAQLRAAKNAYNPNVLPLEVKNRLLKLQREEKQKNQLLKDRWEATERQRAANEVKREESYNPQKQSVSGVDLVDGEAASPRPVRDGGTRRRRRRHKKKSHKKKSHKKKSHKKKSHKKSKRHRRR